MKRIAFLLLFAFVVSACQRETIFPPKTIVVAKTDTIPDTALVRLELVKDSTISYQLGGWVEMMLQFDHRFHASFNNAEDSSPPGYNSNLNIMGVTTDGIPVMWDGVPYTPGMHIPMYVITATGHYLVKIDLLKKVPADINIWFKDKYLKDSVNLRKGNYSFDVNRADTNTFGKKRFEVIVRP